MPKKTQEDMIWYNKINILKPVIIIYKKLKILVESNKRVSYTISQFRKGEFHQDENKEILEKFKSMKNNQSTTII